MNTNELAEKYIKLRDKRDKIMNEAKEKCAPINDLLSRVETALMKKLTEAGANSIATDSGTAYTAVRTSATVADWPITLDFIKEGEKWDLLERRVSKAAVDAYVDEVGQLPPGINYSQERVVRVRRK